MAYYLVLFSPETYDVFTKSNRKVCGFRLAQEVSARQVNVGDKFVCYMTKFSRWVGILEANSQAYKNRSPLFYVSNDPFLIRFQVKPIVWLEKDYTIPIYEERIWDKLSFTRGRKKHSYTWTGKIRCSLRKMEDSDGKFLERSMIKQATKSVPFELDEALYEQLVTERMRRLNQFSIVSQKELGRKQNEL